MNWEKEVTSLLCDPRERKEAEKSTPGDRCPLDAELRDARQEQGTGHREVSGGLSDSGCQVRPPPRMVSVQHILKKFTENAVLLVAS